MKSPEPHLALVAARVAMPTNELLDLLASEVALGADELDEEGRRQIALLWLDAQVESLRDVLCSDPRVVALRSAGSSDDVEVAAAIADVLIAWLRGVPVATVAVLLTRRGLDRICG